MSATSASCQMAVEFCINLENLIESILPCAGAHPKKKFFLVAAAARRAARGSISRRESGADHGPSGSLGRLCPGDFGEGRFSVMPSLVQPAFADARNPDTELELGLESFQSDAYNEQYDKVIHQDFLNSFPDDFKMIPTSHEFFVHVFFRV